MAPIKSNSLSSEVQVDATASAVTHSEQTVEDKKVAARRRFLRVGAQGSAALIVTVAHRRAFAGIKKNVIASACASLQGTPDLVGADKKKALEASAMGTPKGLICRPRPPAHDPNKLNILTGQTKQAKYYKDGFGTPVQYISEKEFNSGLGTLEGPNSTVSASYNYRLYENGYCPIVVDSTGLKYDETAKYYVRSGDGSVKNPYQFTPNSCVVN